MTDQEPKLDDVLFLISRAGDADLTQEEHSQIQAALANSKSVREEHEVYKRLNDWGSRLGQVRPEIDWDSHFDGIQRLLPGVEDTDADRQVPVAEIQVSDEIPELDVLIRRWATDQVEFDSETFVRGVLERVDSKSRTAPRWPHWKLVRPLAAAALIGLTATAWFWDAPRLVNPPPDVVRIVQIGNPSSPAAGPAPVVLVKFDRSQGNVADSVWGTNPEAGLPVVSIVTAGPGPLFGFEQDLVPPA